jgi:hypothetical protein
MKKFLSLLCAMILIVGMLAVGMTAASAAEAAQTVVDVKAGDEVTYALYWSDLPEKVIGTDFSVYYDPSAFQIESVADFNNNTDSDEWVATINPDKAGTGEVLCNWSIINGGVNFSDKRAALTVNLKATEDTSAHLSYYIRYLYGDSAFESEGTPQISQYTFTCDVKVNGQAVLTDAQPELNVEQPQDIGQFLNSVTGQSADAAVNVAEGVGLDTITNNGNNNANQNNGGNNTASAAANSTTSPTGKSNTPGEKNGTIAAATTADGKTAETGETTSDIAATGTKGGSNTILWIIIAAIVVVAGCGVGYFFIRKKRNAAIPKDE